MLNDPAKRQTRKDSDSAVLAEWTDITNVDLLQTVSEVIQHENCRDHRRIDLPCMSNIQAERCFRECHEKRL